MRETNHLAQGHTAHWRQSWDLNNIAGKGERTREVYQQGPGIFFLNRRIAQPEAPGEHPFDPRGRLRSFATASASPPVHPQAQVQGPSLSEVLPWLEPAVLPVL